MFQVVLDSFGKGRKTVRFIQDHNGWVIERNGRSQRYYSHNEAYTNWQMQKNTANRKDYYQRNGKSLRFVDTRILPKRNKQATKFYLNELRYIDYSIHLNAEKKARAVR